MEHKGTVEIETERLLLRRFSIEDVPSVFENWAGDEETVKYLKWPAHTEVGTVEALVLSWISDYSRADFYQWAIVLKENINESIGMIRASKLKESVDAVTIGYCLGSRWWHRGIAPEALKRIISFFFEDVKANRIAAHRDSRNIASGRVMDKCGMQFEGTLRQYYRNNQGIADMSVHSILASDYYSK